MDVTDATSDLAALVRGQRLALRFTQRQAARRAGVSLATWQNLERASAEDRFAELTLSRVAAALRLPVSEVFTAAGRAWEAPEPVEPALDDVAARDAVVIASRELTDLAEVSAEDAQLVARVTRDLCRRLRADLDG